MSEIFCFKILSDGVLINKAFHSNNNINWAHEDSFNSEFNIPFCPDWICLGCYMDGKFVGCIIGFPDGISLEIHIAFLPIVYGKSVVMGEQAIDWIKKNWPKIKQYSASVASNNSLAKRYVMNLGFRFHHHEKVGWLKGGIEYGKDIFLREV